MLSIKRSSKRLFAPLAFLLGVVGLSIFIPVTVSAEEFSSNEVSIRWIDRAHIEVSNITLTIQDGSVSLPLDNAEGIYFDERHIDSDHNYKNYAQDGDCRSQIWVNPDDNPGTVRIRLHTRNPQTGSCKQLEGDVTATDTTNARIWFNWVDATRIESLDGDGIEYGAVFTYNETTQTFLSSYDEDGCRDFVTNISGDKTTGTFTKYGKNRAETNCNDRDPQNISVTLGKVTENSGKPPGSGDPTDNSGDLGNTENDSCESHGTMAWILCPVIEMISSALQWIDNEIQSLLIVDRDKYTDEDLRRVWVNIRNIASIILVIMMLVMVVSTAIGMSFVDAYTVKKALPRMVAAIMFMVLSWYICIFLIDFFNAIGSGTLGLMTAPFRDATVGAGSEPGLGGTLTLTQFFEPDAVGAVLQFGGIIGLTFAATQIPGVLAILGSFLAAGLLIMGIAFLVLMVRQIVIVALVIFGPLAILAWIFPGNDKLWKFWWETFTKLLLMFPIVMALIASGRIFAFVITETPAAGAEGSLLRPILKLMAYVLPYAFIPFTFKAAGGLFGNLVGMANDRGRGMFDRLRKSRQDNLGKIGENLKAGRLTRGATDSNFRGRLNRAAQTGSLLGKAGLRPRLMRSSIESARGARDFDNAVEFLEKGDAARPIKGDDDKMWAAMDGQNEQQIRDILRARAPDRFADTKTLNEAVTEVMRFQKEGGPRVSRIAATIAQAGTGTGFNYRSDGINDDMHDSIIGASGDDRSLSGRMLAQMRQSALQSGRVDLAGGGFAKQAQVIDKRRAALGGGAAYTADEARLEILQDVLQSNAGAAVAGKVEAVRQLAPVMKANADAALTSGDTMAAARELAKLAGKYDAAAQIAPQNAEALADGILAQGIVVSSLPQSIQDMLQVPPGQSGMTYQQAIEQLRGNADFQTMRREYMTSGVAAAQAAQQAALQQPGGGLPPIPGIPPPGGI